jgi:glycosyltransferase involved in cell wall biosynthesis
MRVSIITVCYNRKETIEKSIASVLGQDYPNIEYIVIDGASTDGTKEIIEIYSNAISKYISEPDQGMYDAINKGLHLATGDIIGLMHSDDEFYDQYVVSKIVKAFEKSPNSDAVYGDGIYVSNDDAQKTIRNRIGGAFDFKKIKSGWLPLHPTVYIKRPIIEKYGYYNLDFTIASDTEFLLRYLFQHKINISYLNQYVVKMRMGGMSTSYKRAFQVLQEDYRIYKYHGISAFKTVFLKKLLALLQYVRK